MSEPMRLKLWGVRGSLPVPGPQTMRYGGNTTCLSAELAGKVLVLDAGSGIRLLGNELVGLQTPIYMVLTHNHWDHIQGFPFFKPIYQPERKIYLFPYHCHRETIGSLLDQMDGAHFPVRPEELMSHYECVFDDPVEFLGRHGFQVARIETNHPGGCHGYRLEHNGRAAVFIPDNELEPPGKKTTEFEALVEFCADAEVLIHDAQYLEQDMPLKHGWGHSVISQVLRLGAAAKVKHLVLFHHDPERTDAQVEAIEREAQAWFSHHRPETRCSAAREGMEFSL